MDTLVYLARINYRGTLEPTLQTLQALHEAHLLTVPFENLDIHLHKPISLDIPDLFDKIVIQRRGGFCYELNGLFSQLLSNLGFKVTQIAAGMAHADGSFGPEVDHLALLVHLSEDWLADVGNGDSFRTPLKLQEGLEHREDAQIFRLIQEELYWVLQRRDPDDDSWRSEYRFTRHFHELSDFAERCFYYQTSPNSHFTLNQICSLATREGRITLRNQGFLTTIHGEKHQRILADQQEYIQILADQFGIVLLEREFGHL